MIDLIGSLFAGEKEMILEINDYCQRLKDALLAGFGAKVCYIGLQGSYLRGEATETSDIDIMVILDTLTTKDMNLYRNIIEKLGDFEKSCGFICSRIDMANWNPLESCQLKYATKDIYGQLADFLPKWSMADEVNYIKVSLNNLYHALCHSYIHSNREQLANNLLSHYKAAFFILQNIYFWENYHSGERESVFVLPKAELVKKLQGEDKEVLETTLFLINGGQVDFDNHFELLLHWCQNKIARVSNKIVNI